MKNLVDSSGWMEYFAQGARAEYFKKPIEDAKNLIVPTVCIYEVFKKALQTFDEKKSLEIVSVMWSGAVIDVDHQIALSAAALSHRLKLPMADSIILAIAREHQAVIWTQDADFKGLPLVNYISKK